MLERGERNNQNKEHSREMGILMRNGYSQAVTDQVRERNINVVKTLKEKDKGVQKQTQYNKNKKGTI